MASISTLNALNTSTGMRQKFKCLILYKEKPVMASFISFNYICVNLFIFQ